MTEMSSGGDEMGLSEGERSDGVMEGVMRLPGRVTILRRSEGFELGDYFVSTVMRD